MNEKVHLLFYCFSSFFFFNNISSTKLIKMGSWIIIFFELEEVEEYFNKLQLVYDTMSGNILKYL